jgi:hypothetical protein
MAVIYRADGWRSRARPAALRGCRVDRRDRDARAAVFPRTLRQQHREGPHDLVGCLSAAADWLVTTGHPVVYADYWTGMPLQFAAGSRLTVGVAGGGRRAMEVPRVALGGGRRANGGVRRRPHP